MGSDQVTCDWEMDTRPVCGRKAKFKVTSGPFPFPYWLRYVCGIHERSVTNRGGGCEFLSESEKTRA